MYKKKPETESDVFVLTLPLLYAPWQRRKLDKLFQCYNNVKNALIAKKKNQLKQLERDRRYKSNQKALADIYKQLSETANASLKKELTAKQKDLFAVRNDLIKEYGLDSRMYEKDIHPLQHHYPIVMTHEAAKMAQDVRKSFETYLYDKGKEIRFSSINTFLTINGNTNKDLTVYRDGEVLIGRKQRKTDKPLRLHVSFSKNDAYETECLTHNIHFSSLIRRPVNDGWRYFIQLTLGGKPPNKHRIGQGRVGIDIGTQTIAVSSNTKTMLAVLAENVQDAHNKLCKLQRAMDRSRRNTNPLFFDEEGCIVPINQLPKTCVKNGKRIWVKSKRYSRLQRKVRALHYKEKQLRFQLHNQLANQILGLGSEFYIETMNFRALAKRAKEDKLTASGKHKSKKRFGKSIAHKAPAAFTAILKNKIEHRGGIFREINTWVAKASQFDHTTQAYKKKSLGTRWHRFENGIKIQRDLYSAFLIQCINDSLDGFNSNLLNSTFDRFKMFHDITVSELLASDAVYPSSMGIKKAR